jgi:FixJ family two-component response regulator
MGYMETQIKDSLITLLDAIKASNGVVVVDEMEKLDGFLARGRTELHPQLVHFLEKRSYAKAVMFLGGESDIPVGICGGRAGRAEGN